MKLELEPNMYVRTPYGIDKIKDIVLNGNLYEDSGLYLEKGIKLVCGKEEMKNLKASHNIIDLIEVGDYVNGGQVREKTNEYIRISGGKSLWEYLEKEQDIETIVTKEQFEAMQYEIK